MTYDVGDVATVGVVWTDVTGTTLDATTTLAVTAPDGTVSAPATSHVGASGSGQYTASYLLPQSGVWTHKWTASGALAAVEEGSLLVVAGRHTLGAPYVTTTDLKAYLKITDTADDGAIEDAVMSVSRDIESFCGRQFNDATTTTARVFYPSLYYLLDVDDFSTTAGLIVATDQSDDGTYETVWTAADYQLEPLNGVVDGQPGWPYHRVRAVSGGLFPSFRMASYRRTPVQVTARWGWASVPAPVRQAALLLASEMFKSAGAPFGVAGFGEFGVVRVRDNPKARALLTPYRRRPVLVG